MCLAVYSGDCPPNKNDSISYFGKNPVFLMVLEG